MSGLRSFELARIAGIRVGVDLTWFLILFIFVFNYATSFGSELGSSSAGFAMAVGLAVLFFGSILLHELGHAFAARRQRIHVRGITLFMFGGVMAMDRDPDTPGKEFLVSAAGPAVTALLVLAGGFGSALVAGELGAFLSIPSLSGGGAEAVARVMLGFLAAMNLLLLVFNLVPAYPLDGGRIFRAAVWKVTGQRVRSIRIAAVVGRAFSYLLMAAGLYLVIEGRGGDGIWLLVLGFLLGQGAKAAMAQSAVSSSLEGVTVADVMDADPVTIPASLPVARAWDEYFLRYDGWPWFAVVEDDGRFAGLVYRAALEAAAGDAAAAATPVRTVAAAGDDDGRVDADAPLDALLGSDRLRREGAVMAVDRDGRLKGVVTLEQVSRALQSRLAPRAS